jgi:hypothetical protein
MPRPQPATPRPAPKPADQEKPKEPAPDEISWADTADTGLNGTELSKADFWDLFTGMDEIKETKPVMLYFYWPQEDTDDEKIGNMIRRCDLMEENIFSHEEVRRATLRFHCRKCNLKEDMSDELRKKYKVVMAPKVLFFDVRGKKVWQLTSTKANPEGVAKKMNKIADKSEELLESMKK